MWATTAGPSTALSLIAHLAPLAAAYTGYLFAALRIPGTPHCVHLIPVQLRCSAWYALRCSALRCSALQCYTSQLTCSLSAPHAFDRWRLYLWLLPTSTTVYFLGYALSYGLHICTSTQNHNSEIHVIRENTLFGAGQLHTPWKSMVNDHQAITLFHMRDMIPTWQRTHSTVYLYEVISKNMYCSTKLVACFLSYRKIDWRIEWKSRDLQVFLWSRDPILSATHIVVH